MKRLLKNARVPFVLIVTAGCAKEPEAQGPATAPTTTATATPTTTTVATEAPPTPSASSSSIASASVTASASASVAPPPALEPLVYKHGGGCRQVGDGKNIPCPASGPNVVLPEATSLNQGGQTISLNYGTLECRRYSSMKCPPKVNCNPPPPMPVTCPTALLPKLTNGLKPSKVENDRCWYGNVEVACPKP